MRKDRRLNGWVALGSAIEIILSFILLIGGVALASAGFLYKTKLAEIDDLQYFIYQDGIIKFQEFIFNNKLLKIEYLYLILGIIVAVVGLIAFIFGIISFAYGKKRKVVRRRVALLIFTLVPLAIAGCALTYLLLEFDILTDNIKYIAYGITGGFGFVALCKILGVIFGRSEKFMSNDNNKYAFDNSSLRNARADINNNIRANQNQHNNQMAQPMPNANQGPRPVQQGQPLPPRPNQPMRTNAPQGSAQNRPMPPRPNQPMPQGARPVRPAQPGGMPQRSMAQGGAQRPVQSMRPAPQGQRPVGAPNNRPVVEGARYCPKCGKMLSPSEKICTLCGYKVQN